MNEKRSRQWKKFACVESSRVSPRRCRQPINHEGGTSSDNAYISWSYSPPSSVGWSLTSRTLLSITYRSLEQGMPEYTKISFASDYLHRGLTCSADGIVMSTTIPGRFSVPVDVAVGHIRGVCKSLASGLVPSKSAPKGSRRRMSYERRYWREML